MNSRTAPLGNVNLISLFFACCLICAGFQALDELDGLAMRSLNREWSNS